MENFQTENSISNDTPRIMDFKKPKINPETSISEPSMRKTLDQNDTAPLRPTLKRKVI
jgi:hypothetical protein